MSRLRQWVGRLGSRDKDLHDKRDLQEEQHKPVEQSHYDVGREGGVGDMVRVVLVTRRSANKVANADEGSEDP